MGVYFSPILFDYTVFENSKETTFIDQISEAGQSFIDTTNIEAPFGALDYSDVEAGQWPYDNWEYGPLCLTGCVRNILSKVYPEDIYQLEIHQILSKISCDVGNLDYKKTEPIYGYISDIEIKRLTMLLPKFQSIPKKYTQHGNQVEVLLHVMQIADKISTTHNIRVGLFMMTT